MKNDNASHREKEKWFLHRISGKKIFHEIHALRIDIFPDEMNRNSDIWQACVEEIRVRRDKMAKTRV